jgi:hypothetical protein
MPGEALACTPSHGTRLGEVLVCASSKGGLGQAKCLLEYPFILFFPSPSLVAVILLSVLLDGGGGQPVLCYPSSLALPKGEFGDVSLQHWLSPGRRGQGTSGGGGSVSRIGPIQW